VKDVGALQLCPQGVHNRVIALTHPRTAANVAAVPGGNVMEDAETYRGRATHARLGAREATNPAHRAIFERLAESYEKLAREAEWFETSDSNDQGSPN
jgi:hypothetical protein